MFIWTLTTYSNVQSKFEKKYDVLNQAQGRTTWTEQDYMAGFVGDVGDLSKIVMAKANRRDMDDVDAKLVHELNDCLWSIFVLADKYNIKLADEFMKTMNELDRKIDEKLTK